VKLLYGAGVLVEQQYASTAPLQITSRSSAILAGMS
jgi:hypothetical protein